MNDFINWLVANWQFVSSAAISVIGFILLLIFKRTKIVDPSVYTDVIEYVKEAEKIFGDGHGKEKNDFVMTRLAQTRGISKLFASLAYGFFVENVLSTPAKKVK